MDVVVGAPARHAWVECDAEMRVRVRAAARAADAADGFVVVAVVPMEDAAAACGVVVHVVPALRWVAVVRDAAGLRAAADALDGLLRTLLQRGVRVTGWFQPDGMLRACREALVDVAPGGGRRASRTGEEAWCACARDVARRVAACALHGAVACCGGGSASVPRAAFVAAFEGSAVSFEGHGDEAAAGGCGDEAEGARAVAALARLVATCRAEFGTLRGAAWAARFCAEAPCAEAGAVTRVAGAALLHLLALAGLDESRATRGGVGWCGGAACCDRGDDVCGSGGVAHDDNDDNDDVAGFHRAQHTRAIPAPAATTHGRWCTVAQACIVTCDGVVA